jgi:hypothetical protein
MATVARKYMPVPLAARVAKDAGAALVIPCHYEMFEFNTASPEGFVEECETRPAVSSAPCR